MGKIGEKVKQALRNWLSIQPAPQQAITIVEQSSFAAEAVKNRIWYRGDGDELRQLYRQLGSDGGRFWAAVPPGEKIRKLHSGLPALMVDTLAYIVKSDLQPVEFEGGGPACWEAMERELDLPALVGTAVTDALVTGDGAFKISVDPQLSEYPLCEFYSADRVEYDRARGRVQAVRFYTDYPVGYKTYRLEEVYAPGKVRYHLYDGEREVALGTVPALADLHPVDFAGDYSMAVPLRIYDSAKYSGRGKSIFATKTDAFDAHDEVISQWVDAIRKGRVQRYIPEDMIPRDPANGRLLGVDAFGADFIRLQASAKEGVASKMEMLQPEIKYEAYLGTYTATLDMCLQGILSPATLGIDLGKMASAEAQREKKDITGHTRNAITAALEKTLPKLIAALLMTYDNMQGKAPGSYEPVVSFGEYGAPDFGSRAEVVNKAATAGTMSIQAQVDELWGDSKDEKWKRDEVLRLKQERGILQAQPPGVGDELQ